MNRRSFLSLPTAVVPIAAVQTVSAPPVTISICGPFVLNGPATIGDIIAAAAAQSAREAEATKLSKQIFEQLQLAFAAAGIDDGASFVPELERLLRVNLADASPRPVAQKTLLGHQP